MRIAIGADQVGYPLKEHMARWLTGQGHRVDDRDSDGTQRVDYPLICADVGRQVVRGAADRGIVVGGSGLGETMRGRQTASPLARS